MSVILESLPVGEKLALHFLAGSTPRPLSTGMRLKGAIPYAYTATWASPMKPTTTRYPRKALEYGAERPASLDCRAPWFAKASPRCRPAPSTSPLRGCRTSTPRRSAALSPAPCSSPPCGGRRQHLGRRLYLQGNDIERFYATACSSIRPQGLQTLARRRIHR